MARRLLTAAAVAVTIGILLVFAVAPIVAEIWFAFSR
jgi:hypothetical protein